ncbi:amidohydrolase family protein [Acidovorax sp.]|uniref:amidohydrolase family protein n=1 Tax=Acidovorax sp. TaxID=1872122 RepID=UPI00391C7886
MSAPPLGTSTASAPSTAALDGWDTHVHIFDGAAQAQPGHYQPAHHPIDRIEAEAAGLGVGHLVLVQPSVYGTDNQLVLNALRASGGRHRGVVVVDGNVQAAALQAMHALGVRGVRFNLVSPVGNGQDALPRLSGLLRELGWHLQWYARPEQLGQIADVHQRTGLPCVLDHLAGLHTQLPARDAAWDALQRLAGAGAWVKLSGWYRLGDHAPYIRITEHIQRVATIAPGRLVWGSDWPHTAFDAAAMPAYRSVWTPVEDALGTSRAHEVLRAGARLYG